MNAHNKTRVIDRLQELANRDYQSRVWLAESGPEISSFTEAICGLFDDTGLSIAFDKGRLVFTKKIDALLYELGAAVQEVNEFQAPENLIADPKMERVRRLASDALVAIERIE